MTVNNYSHKKPCAFRDLIQTRYSANLYKKIAKIIVDPVASRKLVVDIIEEACEYYTSCPPVNELQTFLYTQAYNKSLEQKRRQLSSSF